MAWCSLCLAAEDEDVIHVDNYNSFVDQLLEDVIHPCRNVTGLLVRPKNMTRGSNRPWFIRKATVHSSPSLILMLLYPHWMSSLVKYFTLALDTVFEDVGDKG